MFENEFYPTPEDLAARMVGMVDLAKVRTVLEPSAGKGDLLDALEKRIKESYYRYDANKYDIDCIEFDEDLFVHQLEELNELSKMDSPDIKKRVAEIVPTYHMEEKRQ